MSAFDRIDLDILRECPSPKAAADMIHDQVAREDDSDSLHTKLIYRFIRDALDCAASEFRGRDRDVKGVALRMEVDFVTEVEVVLGSNRGRNVCVRVGNGRLVVIDRTCFTRLLLYLFFASRERTYARHLSAWILLHHCVENDAPLPL